MEFADEGYFPNPQDLVGHPVQINLQEKVTALQKEVDMLKKFISAKFGDEYNSFVDSMSPINNFKVEAEEVDIPEDGDYHGEEDTFRIEHFHHTVGPGDYSEETEIILPIVSGCLSVSSIPDYQSPIPIKSSKRKAIIGHRNVTEGEPRPTPTRLSEWEREKKAGTFQCVVCRKFFSTANQRFHHVRTFHYKPGFRSEMMNVNGVPMMQRREVYKCCLCKNDYAKEKSVISHVQFHLRKAVLGVESPLGLVN